MIPSIVINQESSNLFEEKVEENISNHSKRTSILSFFNFSKRNSNGPSRRESNMTQAHSPTLIKTIYSSGNFFYNFSKN